MYTIMPAHMQFLHPLETRSYKEAARAIRRMGRACILERIETIERRESIPNDLLTHMLEFASMPEYVCYNNNNSSFSLGLHQDIDLEDLIDDFTTFYTAGNSTDHQEHVTVLRDPTVTEDPTDHIDISL